MGPSKEFESPGWSQSLASCSASSSWQRQSEASSSWWRWTASAVGPQGEGFLQQGGEEAVGSPLGKTSSIWPSHPPPQCQLLAPQGCRASVAVDLIPWTAGIGCWLYLRAVDCWEMLTQLHWIHLSTQYIYPKPMWDCTKLCLFVANTKHLLVCRQICRIFSILRFACFDKKKKYIPGWKWLMAYFKPDTLRRTAKQ